MSKANHNSMDNFIELQIVGIKYLQMTKGRFTSTAKKQNSYE
jgi:hypothetical protein